MAFGRLCRVAASISPHALTSSLDWVQPETRVIVVKICVDNNSALESNDGLSPAVRPSPLQSGA